MFSQAEKKSYWNGYHKGKAEGRNEAKPRGSVKSKRPYLCVSDDIDDVMDARPNHLGIIGVLGSMPVGPSLIPRRNWTDEELEFLKKSDRWKADYYCDIEAESDNYVNSVLRTGGAW